jgi:hypothetical protein
MKCAFLITMFNKYNVVKQNINSNIKITNPYTSEQCLGDELLSHLTSVENFHNKTLKISNGIPSEYGISLHCL